MNEFPSCLLSTIETTGRLQAPVGVCTDISYSSRRYVHGDRFGFVSHRGTTFGLFVFFPGVLLSSRVTGACPVTTDLIMRANVRTTIGIGVRTLTTTKIYPEACL